MKLRALQALFVLLPLCLVPGPAQDSAQKPAQAVAALQAALAQHEVWLEPELGLCAIPARVTSTYSSASERTSTRAWIAQASSAGSSQIPCCASTCWSAAEPLSGLPAGGSCGAAGSRQSGSSAMAASGFMAWA